MADRLLSGASQLQQRAQAQAQTAQQAAAARTAALTAQTGKAALGESLSQSANPLLSGVGQGLSAVESFKAAGSRKEALEQLVADAKAQQEALNAAIAAQQQEKATLQRVTDIAPEVTKLIGQARTGGDAERQLAEQQLSFLANDAGIENTGVVINSAGGLNIMTPQGEQRVGVSEILDLIPEGDIKQVAIERLTGATTEAARQEGQAQRTEAEATLGRDLRAGEPEALAGVVQRTATVPAGFDEAVSQQARQATAQAFGTRIEGAFTDAQAARGQSVAIDNLINTVDTANTGSAAEFASALNSFGQQVGVDLGLDPRGEIGQINASTQLLIQPFIEAQGRSFSDADRAALERSFPSGQNSKTTNRALTGFALATGLANQNRADLITEYTRTGREAELPAVLDSYDAQVGGSIISAVNLIRNNPDIPMKTLADRIKQGYGR